MFGHIELVFKWLEEFNLKIKPQICHFFHHSIIFLGYVLSTDGKSANPKKVDKVNNWPVPTNPKELQSFLGLALYYHQFIPKFAAITKCLHQLLGPANHQKRKKGKNNEPKVNQNKENFTWTGEHQEVIWPPKDLLDQCTCAGLPRFQLTVWIGDWCIFTRAGCHTFSKGWKWH